MIYKRIYTLLLILSCISLQVNAAFPVVAKHNYTCSQPAITDVNNIDSRSVISHVKQKPDDVTTGKGKGNKKRWAAILLGVFLGAFGVHRFYLGYTWQGILQAMAYPLLYAGILLAAFPPVGIATTSAVALTAFCIGGAIGIWIWRWVDIIRIASDTLKPADGSNYSD